MAIGDAVNIIASMDRNQKALMSAVALVLFGVLLGIWHLLATGVSTDFGAGLAVGAIITGGMLGILSRRVRDLD